MNCTMAEDRAAGGSDDDFEDEVPMNFTRNKREQSNAVPSAPRKKARSASPSIPTPDARSRNANGKAKRSLGAKFDFNKKKITYSMESAKSKLLKTKKTLYPKGLSEDIVKEHPEMERFVCWTSAIFKGCGVSRSTSGSSNRSFTGVYFKISVGKDVKYQAHKLMLCLKKKIVYNELQNDASHLCHNRLCWRPKHLCHEPHAENMNRNMGGVGCGGWLFDSIKKELCCLCEHKPTCKFVRVIKKPWVPL